MLLHRRICSLVTMFAFAICNIALATEPNEFFAQSTILAPGVFSVNDDLTPGFVTYPDTVLGTRGIFGDIDFFDDDGSPLGDGQASGIGGAPTNSGSIDFAVSGYPDEFFEGGHGEFGEYEVFIDVYDFFDDLVDQFSQTATLQPGNVDEYSFSDFEWINGSYDVYIDNTVGGVSGADVDFFTFTGLTAGASFSAEVTQEPYTGFDSVLGWFDEAGNLIETSDQGGFGNLSLLEGIVPAIGTLTFAVTGYDDFDFLGSHSEDAEYTLQLTIGDVDVPGDFDGDGDVDGADFVVWQTNFPTETGATLATGDADGDGDVDGADFVIWQTNFPFTPSSGIATVPEPQAWMLFVLSLSGLVSVRRRKR